MTMGMEKPTRDGFATPAAVVYLKPAVVTRKQAGELLGGAGRWRLDRLIETGRLVALRDADRVLITVESIEAYIASLPKITPKAKEGAP
jgi:hypothetical protein